MHFDIKKKNKKVSCHSSLLYFYFQQVRIVIREKVLVSSQYSLWWHFWVCISSVRVLLEKIIYICKNARLQKKSVISLTNFLTVIYLTLLTLMFKLQHVSPVSCYLTKWFSGELNLIHNLLALPATVQTVFQIVLCSLRIVIKKAWNGQRWKVNCCV